MSAAQHKVLFVGLEGPIVLAEPRRQAAVYASYARPFLFWASSIFRVVMLSRRGPGPVARAAADLGLPGDALAIGSFGASPIEAVARVRDPLWVDLRLSPKELDWCRDHLGVRFIPVDPSVGVTPGVRERVLAVHQGRI